MLKLGGFWSYVHADDTAEFGRIADLGRDLVSQYEMLTGESIELFLDRDSLEWGTEWKAKVDGSLSSVAFFIPVVTPRYFQSAECRRELRTFAQKAQALGLAELVLPLIYVDFGGLYEENPSDELITMVKKFQWEIWTDVRFEPRGSAVYQRRVSELAERLVRANAAATESAAAAAGTPADEGAEPEGEEPPGIVDLMAEAEAALPRWSATLERLGSIIEDLGTSMEGAQADMEAADKRGKGFAGRLTAFHKLAMELSEPGDEVLRLSSDFVQQLNAVDAGIRAIVGMATQSVAEDPEQAEEIRDFFRSIRNLSESSHEGLGAISSMLEQMEPIETMSRDLRPVLKKYRRGLTDMSEGRAITDEWVRLIDEVQLPGDEGGEATP